jgi:hypothetical protein
MLSFQRGDDMADWITVSMASRQTGIAERTIRDWITKGKVTAKKEKGRWLIDPDSLSAVGKAIANESAISAKESMISVPLERYEGLITRLAQLEAENTEYKKMLESSEMKRRRQSWWSKLWKRSPDERN